MLGSCSFCWLLLASLQVTWGSTNGRCEVNLTSISRGSAIYSPGYYSGYYKANEQCDWYIVPEMENFSVLIKFRYMGIQPGCCDHLAIYANPPTYTTLVGWYNGSIVPYNVLYDGPLRIHFESDDVAVGSIYDYRGFQIYYYVYQGLAPRFVSIANDTNVIRGDEVLLPCQVMGFPLPVVTWYKDGLEVHSILRSEFTFQGNDLLLKGVVDEDSGFFKCKAENYLNSTEQVFQLYVQVRPSVRTHPISMHFETIFDNSIDYFDYDGSTSTSDDYYYYYSYSTGNYNQLPAVFRCEVSGTPKPTVYWKKDGQFLLNPFTQNDWLLITHVNVSDEGNYSCFANNSIGSVESRNASLTIGEILPCCFSSYRVVDPYYPYSRYLGDNLSLQFTIQYRSYKVSNITVTRDIGDQRLQLKQIEVFSRRRPYISIGLGKAAATYIDTGVYGFHLQLLSSSKSNSTDRNKSIPLSFYIPIFITVPPVITISPSKVILRNPEERLNITCSVWSAYSSLWLHWLKNNTNIGQWQRIKANGLDVYKSYLRVTNTFDDVEVRHYTCAVDYYGSRNYATASVSVVTRVTSGGWSWWTETLPCSEPCGSNRGFRLRSRHCYKQDTRCSGDNTAKMYCYPPLRYCPAVDVPSTSQPPATGNYSTMLSINASQSQSEVHGSSHSVSTVVISCVVTGIVATVVTAILTYLIMRRKHRQEIVEYTRSNVTTTSTMDSHRYVSTEPKLRQIEKKDAAKPASKYSSTESKTRTPSKLTSRPSLKEQTNKPKSVSVKYSNREDEVYEPVGKSARAPESGEGYLQPVRQKSGNDDFYTPMIPHPQEESTIYSNVPDPPDEELYANQ